MIDQKKSPHPSAGKLKGLRGDIERYTISVPVQLKRLRKKPDLVRFEGDYYTLDGLLSQARWGRTGGP